MVCYMKVGSSLVLLVFIFYGLIFYFCFLEEGVGMIGYLSCLCFFYLLEVIVLVWLLGGFCKYSTSKFYFLVNFVLISSGGLFLCIGVSWFEVGFVFVKGESILLIFLGFVFLLEVFFLVNSSNVGYIYSFLKSWVGKKSGLMF